MPRGTIQIGRITTVLLSLLLSACETKPDWIDIGVGPDESEMPYRLIELVRKDGSIVKKSHIDLAGPTLEAQSGKAIRKWIYLPISRCFSPSVRNRQSSLICYAATGGSVVIAAEDNIREVLMSLEARQKVAAVKGLIIGTYSGDAMIFVNDPLLKP